MSGIYSQSGLANALDAGNGLLLIGAVLQEHPNHASPIFIHDFVIPDVALFFEDSGKLLLQAGSRECQPDRGWQSWRCVYAPAYRRSDQSSPSTSLPPSNAPTNWPSLLLGSVHDGLAPENRCGTSESLAYSSADDRKSCSGFCDEPVLERFTFSDDLRLLGHAKPPLNYALRKGIPKARSSS